MSPITWETFDADKPDPKMDMEIREMSAKILTIKGINNDRSTISSFAAKHIRDYDTGCNPELDTTLVVHVFRPHEFDSDCSNDESLDILRNWLLSQSFNWRDGSRTVQLALDVFSSGGSKRSKGGREYVELDNLVVIRGRRIAIEIETSNNLDNGFWTLRQKLRLREADYGVMIVPWTAEKTGRADEGKALGRLDREFEGSRNMSDGPIYHIAIIRQLDIYRLML